MRKTQANRLIALLLCFSAFVLGLGAKVIYQSFNVLLFKNAYFILWTISFLILLILIPEYFISNQILKGFAYFWLYRKTKNILEKQMLDAGFGLQRSYYIELPKVHLSFDNSLSTGQLKIRNAIKFDRKLDDIIFSAALGKFAVENHYITDDGNFYVYNLIDGSVSFKLIFESFGDFLEHTKRLSPYDLLLDGRSCVRLQHTLLAGQTGSGKSVMLLTTVLQMVTKPISYQLFFADPKGSAHAVLGSYIAPNRTAIGIHDIVSLLEEFVGLMQVRKKEMRELLRSDLTGDYASFGLAPYVFLFEEFGSYSSVLASEDKKLRDKSNALLHEIVLTGRQLGFFLFAICQQPSAQTLSTSLRENLPLKILLNPTEQQTKITTFGAGVDVPKRHYLVGEGAFTEPILAPAPKLIQCPYCKFDIIQAILSRGGVTTPAPDQTSLQNFN